MKLSTQAIDILEQLKKHGDRTVEQLEQSGFDQSMVNRAAMELQEKGLIELEEEEEVTRYLTETGKEVAAKGSPEHKLIERVDDGDKSLSNLQDLNLDVGLGKARKKAWIEIEGGSVALTDAGKEALAEDELKARLNEEDFMQRDEDRGLVDTEVEMTRRLELTEKGQDLDLEDVEEDFNVEARVQTPRTGRKHFYKNIIDFARDTWMELGFEEMNGDFVVSSLMNFDALYTPQDHPARELQDTFFMKRPGSSNLEDYGSLVGRIEKTHEDGWSTGSKGWNYHWGPEEAARNVIRTHTTAVSAAKLDELSEDDLPKKCFTVARNFRNETVDRHHLPEFIQTDGIVVGQDLSFKNLKGYISEFFERFGFEEFRLIPSYYPYTEMSVEVQVWDEEAEEWIGLGGAGMFRPEVVKPLLGFEARVLAWGLGIGRIAMKAAQLDDIRELYRNDIENLEETPVWRPQ